MAFLLIAMGLVGCFRLYYQTNSLGKTDAVQLEQLLKQDKIFIVHSPADVFEMEFVKIDGDHLTGNRVALDPKYDKLLNPGRQNNNSVNRRIKKVCFEQVHLYTSSIIHNRDSVSLPIQDISRMDVYSPDKAAIRESRTASIIGITLCAGAIIGLGFYIASTIVFF